MKERTSAVSKACCALGLGVWLFAACSGRVQVDGQGDPSGAGGIAANAGRGGSLFSSAGSGNGGASRAGASQGGAGQSGMSDGASEAGATAGSVGDGGASTGGTNGSQDYDGWGGEAGGVIDQEECESGRQAYSVERSELDENHSFGCTTTSDCLWARTYNLCEVNCRAAPIPSSRLAAYEADVDALSKKYCSKCSRPKSVCYWQTTKMCNSGQCVFSD